MRRTRTPTVVIASALLWACGGAAEEQPQRTEHERDSLIARSQLPGAVGVGAALRAQDRANSSNSVVDSIARSVR
jgi:hypothetical protein